MVTEGLKGKDYISTQDWSKEELEELLRFASELKDKKKKGIPHRYCQDKTIFLLFFDKSTRTRNAFEAGITQLGGHAHYIDVQTSQIAHGENAKDTGIILSSYGHAIAIRHDLVPGEGNAYMREIARWAEVPVINLQCDIDHPTQTIADLMTIRERFGTNLRGLRMVVSWAYTPSYAKPLSVPQGLLLLMPRFGLDLVVAHPKEFKLMPEVIEIAKQNARENNVNIEFTDNMKDAFAGADIVYPKSWGVLELFDKPQEALALAEKYKEWRCDEGMMKLAREHAIYMHCLPADRGNEVTDEVIDGAQSVVYQEAENRLHTAKAIMALTM
ncbi:ornithine carbamoyltransferase [Candidatus Sumerlaeota bacterium]|nr:ornithine carbamoyltransferase [Candidatus Sumerlaeota bacterium]